MEKIFVLFRPEFDESGGMTQVFVAAARTPQTLVNLAAEYGAKLVERNPEDTDSYGTRFEVHCWTDRNGGWAIYEDGLLD